MPQSKVARQKIVNKENETVAYEMLYRNGNLADLNLNDDEITLDVIVTSFFKIGYGSISDGAKLAINFGNSDLIDEVSEVIPSQQMIFEILETADMNDELIEKLKSLKAKGFTVALDDFEIETVKNEEIYKYVDIIKVDFIKSTPEEKLAIENIAKKYPNITLLAEKIENRAEYNYAIEAGYDLFQGYYIDKPELISHDE